MNSKATSPPPPQNPSPSREPRTEGARPPDDAVEPAPKPPSWPPTPPAIQSSFCLEGVMNALVDDACYALPAKPTTNLLIYLPGLTPPSLDSNEKHTVQTVVRRATQRASIAALVPRGPTRNELSPHAKDQQYLDEYFSWPTGDEAYARHAHRLVARIREQQRTLEQLTGAPFRRVFLAGSSAGAYFVAHLFLRGDFPADGYAVLSGGSGRPAPHLLEQPRRPVYVGYGDGDVVGPKANAFAAQVRAAGFPVRVEVHHTSHGAKDVYLEEAFAHFGVE